jgi:hypothetical protein
MLVLYEGYGPAHTRGMVLGILLILEILARTSFLEALATPSDAFVVYYGGEC